MSDSVCVFWDFSNIYYSAREVAAKRGESPQRLRLHAENLWGIVTRNRVVTRRHCVGSYTHGTVVVRDQLRYRLGIELELFERGRYSGREQAVDQALQVSMLRARASMSPQTAVLLGGDGRGYADGVGFHADLNALHEAGWKIEVFSWDHSCARRLRAWARDVGVFVSLDDLYEQITFIEGGRRARKPEGDPPPSAASALCLAA